MMSRGKVVLQSVFGYFGYHISQRQRGASLDSALSEQFRLMGQNVACIVEVGSADGRDSQMYAEKFPTAKIHAFEPLAENFEKLSKRAAANSRILAINSAVSDHAGFAKFHVTNLPDASSLFAPNRTGSTFDKYTELERLTDVSVMTLDSYVAANDLKSIDLLKIDAQGAELKILAGARKLLERRGINVIYTEMNFMNIYSGGAKWFEISAFLNQFGYQLHGIYNMTHNQNAKLAWCDAIFVRDDNLQ